MVLEEKEKTEKMGEKKEESEEVVGEKNQLDTKASTTPDKILLGEKKLMIQGPLDGSGEAATVVETEEDKGEAEETKEE